jgi:hypothetical protein
MIFETDISEANRKIALWTNTAEALGKLCRYRHSGFCLTNCPGLLICNTDDLHMLPHYEIPEHIKP